MLRYGHASHGAHAVAQVLLLYRLTPATASEMATTTARTMRDGFIQPPTGSVEIVDKYTLDEVMVTTPMT